MRNARSAFAHCPSGENARAVDEAEGCVNRLLDELDDEALAALREAREA